jgi:hypothetical protein
MFSIIQSLFYPYTYHVKKLSDIQNVPVIHRKYIFDFLSKNGLTIPYNENINIKNIVVHEMSTNNFTTIYIYCVKRRSYIREVITNNNSYYNCSLDETIPLFENCN